jgi:hypothetical protein
MKDDPYMKLLDAAKSALDQAQNRKGTPCALCGEEPHARGCAVPLLEMALQKENR